MKTMIRIATVALFVFYSFTGQAQKCVGSYTLSFHPGHEYEIYAQLDDNEKLIYSLSAVSHNPLYNQVMVVIKENDYQAFISSLENVRNMYTSRRAAIKEGVKDINEKVEIENSPTIAGKFFIDDIWYFDSSISLSYKIITYKGQIVLVADAGNLKDDKSNKNHPGFYFLFSEPGDIDDFIKSLDIVRHKTYF